jgi:hypothetical protein
MIFYTYYIVFRLGLAFVMDLDQFLYKVNAYRL